jgi:anti-sigma B factor antagonist
MRPMHMTERNVGSVTILDLAGRITIDEDAARLKDKIDSLLLRQQTSVILNLAEVSYIDSGGLGQLAASYAALMKAGGELKLLNVTKRTYDLLSITRLATIFQIFDTEDAALGSFDRLPTLSAGMVAQ